MQHDVLRRLIARDRLPPPPRPHGELGGWLRWELIDRAGRVRRGGEQHNLITNAGLDLFASVAIETLTTYCAVGTGSAAPDATDETLGAEAARTATAGPGDSDDVTRPSTGVNRIVRVREFDFNEANGNLTEWGFTNASTGGQLFARELFRDGSGDPATVTKTSDDKLRMTYTLEFTYGPNVATPFTPLVIDGIGTINGDYLIVENSSGSGNYALEAWSGYARGMANARLAIDRALDALEPFVYFTNAGLDDGAATFAEYVPGSYQRVMTEMLWSTGAGNDDWHGLWMRSPIATRPSGLWMKFDVADRFTKANTHSLTLTNPLTISWARGTP